MPTLTDKVVSQKVMGRHDGNMSAIHSTTALWKSPLVLKPFSTFRESPVGTLIYLGSSTCTMAEHTFLYNNTHSCLGNFEQVPNGPVVCCCCQPPQSKGNSLLNWLWCFPSLLLAGAHCTNTQMYCVTIENFPASHSV